MQSLWMSKEELKEKTKSQKFASCIKLTKPFITGKTAQIEIV
jgi:hypothetical protein